MLVYHYSKNTFAFLGSEEGIPDQAEPGVTLVPAQATLIVPPITSDSEIAIFDESTETWSVQSNFLGRVGYDKTTGDDAIIKTAGDLPSNITLLAPATEVDVWDEVNSRWETPLVEVKELYNRDIDKAAENARGRYITKGAGQAATYQEKANEATNFVAAGYPTDLTDYLFIQAEVAATGKTAKLAVDDILAQRAAWVVVGAQIEEVRIGGKVAVKAATDLTDIESASSNTITTLESI